MSGIYDDPSAVFNHEVEWCNKLYLGRDDEDTIVSFLMTGWTTKDLFGQNVDTIYIGWTGAGKSLKNSAVHFQTLRYFLREALNWEKDHKRRFLLWGTTATPVVYFMAHNHLSEMSPAQDGTYTAEGAELAHALRESLNLGAATEHPFVLSRWSPYARYSQEESARIAELCGRFEFTLFDKLGVNEQAGDQLLFICRLRHPKETN